MTKHNAIFISPLHQIFCGDENLSCQQKDIILMYSLGISIDEISENQGIKPSTVKKHLDNVRIELGAMRLSDVKTMINFRTSALIITMLTKILEKGNL